MPYAKDRTKLTDSAIEAAYRRRDARLSTEPLASTVRYSPARDMVLLEMTNGAGLTVPRQLLQGLENLSGAELKDVVVRGRGTTIAWPDVDIEFTVVALLYGVYGGKRWMSELARRAGSATSTAKKKASRANGAKGGRPRKAVA